MKALLQVRHVMREAGAARSKLHSYPLPAQNYVVVERAAAIRQLICISKDEWARVRLLIDAALKD